MLIIIDNLHSKPIALLAQCLRIYQICQYYVNYRMRTLFVPIQITHSGLARQPFPARASSLDKSKIQHVPPPYQPNRVTFSQQREVQVLIGENPYVHKLIFFVWLRITSIIELRKLELQPRLEPQFFQPNRVLGSTLYLIKGTAGGQGYKKGGVRISALYI